MLVHPQNKGCHVCKLRYTVRAVYQGEQMHCPKCGFEDSKVVDSRPSESNDAIRRRRECLKCGFRFTTYERREDLPLMVIKSNNKREPFDRQKLMRGLVAATVKRDIDVARLDALIDTVESNLRDKNVMEVSSKQLGEKVLRLLRKMDKVAYVRFASVYRDFEDPQEFNEELKRLGK